MVMEFIKGLFGKSSREDTYDLTKEELDNVTNLIERRIAEQKLERITRVMTTDSIKSEGGFWTVALTYEEERIDEKGESDKADVGCKSISRDLDMAISDAYFTLQTILAEVGGDLFRLKEQKKSETP